MIRWLPKTRHAWQRLLNQISVCLAGTLGSIKAADVARVIAFEPLEQRLPMTAGLVDVGAQPTGSLDGKLVFTSAGHGWRWSSTLNRWATDRGNLLSVVEDFGNADQTTLYVDYLHRAGATVIPMRPVGRQVNEVVLDNDSPGVTFTGAWSTNTAGPRWYDEDYGANLDSAKYRFAGVNSQAETSTATYTPDIPAAGMYPVYTWVSHSLNRTNQLYRINHTGGATEVRVDHRKVGNGWVYLGTYHFADGSDPSSGSVQISNRSADGGSVVIADAIRFGNGMGDIPWNNSGIGNGSVSGYPREDEASLLWTWRSVGQSTSFTSPSAIVGTSNVSAPIKMAEYMNADSNPYGTSVYVGFHSNATTGNPATATARGAIGLVRSSSPTPNQSDLATFLAEQINLDMRALDGEFEHDWSTRTRYTLTGQFGEISNVHADSEFDATIIEVAFHDNTQDTELLRDARVRDQLARSTYEGTLEHLRAHSGTTTTPPNVTLPSPPIDVSATSDASGQVSVQWTAGDSSSGGVSGVHGSPATGFRVYASIDGYGFDGGTYFAGSTLTSATLDGYDPDQTYFFKVVAENAGGQSRASEVMAVTPNGGDRQVLIVNGFDRVDRSRNFQQLFLSNTATTDRVWERYGNSRDYVVQVATAIQSARPGVRVDSTSNEAVIDGTVQLTDYDAVVWNLGTESVADDTFDSTEQVLAEQFVAAGGDLLVHGAEIGFDLDLRNNGRDFYRNTLGASYAADSAGRYDVSADATGIFAGLAGFNFSDGAEFSSLDGQTYDVRFADVLSPQPGSSVALRYGGASGSVAAIQKPAAGGRGNVLNFGFPLETIVGTEPRSQLFDRVLTFFDVQPVVAVAPRVTDVIIGSSDWTPTMIDAVDGGGTGAGNGLGLSLVGAEQLVNLPWTNLDRIYVQFSDDVSATFSTDSVDLQGTNVTDYATEIQLIYGQDGVDIGTLQLSTPIGADALILSLADTITSNDGLSLDGEWTETISTVSGDGSAGGPFQFRFDVLPGDVTNNDGVNTTDVLQVNGQRGALTTDLATARFDINGNGGVNTTDVLLVNEKRGTILPAAPVLLIPLTAPSTASVEEETALLDVAAGVDQVLGNYCSAFEAESLHEFSMLAPGDQPLEVPELIPNVRPTTFVGPIRDVKSIALPSEPGDAVLVSPSEASELVPGPLTYDDYLRRRDRFIAKGADGNGPNHAAIDMHFAGEQRRF